MERVILASASPRRKEILERYNLEVIISPSSIIEKLNKDENPEQIAMTLALNKALNVSIKFTDDLVIGADTIVVHQGTILGKPKDNEDAYRILTRLSGSTHHVITGVAIVKLSSNLKIIDYETTKVKFRNLSSDTILKYIRSEEPLDKAGAYGIQGLGAILVEKIDGCYFNVVGLPLAKIDNLLQRYLDFKIL